MGTFTSELTFGEYAYGSMAESPGILFKTLQYTGGALTPALTPALSLDFTAGSLDPRITVSRASGKTYFDSSGAIQLAAANTAYFDYDPATLTARGLLIEEARINALRNSLLDGTNLSTQSVGMPATTFTLSFYGTGTITLSGASTAGPLVGTGMSTRVSLTFTPSVGLVTFTVSGTVKWANLEVGSFATSFIPTAGSPATRAADIVSMTGTNFSDWFNSAEGTFVAEYKAEAFASAARIFGTSDGTNANRISMFEQASTIARAEGVTSSISQFILDNTITTIDGAVHKTALAYKTNDFASCSDNGSVATDTSGSVPSGLNVLSLGSYEWGTGGNYFNGWLRSFKYYNNRLPDATLQELTV